MLFRKKMFPNFSAGIPVTHLPWPGRSGGRLECRCCWGGRRRLGLGWGGLLHSSSRAPKVTVRPGGARPRSQCTCEGNCHHCIGSILFSSGKNFLNAENDMTTFCWAHTLPQSTVFIAVSTSFRLIFQANSRSLRPVVSWFKKQGRGRGGGRATDGLGSGLCVLSRVCLRPHGL